MTVKVQPTLIQKNDLIKDYINFALVIILSFFFKYSTLELAESISFFSVVLAVSMLLFQLIKCFEYNNFSVARLGNIIGSGVVYAILYIGILQGIREVLGVKEVPISIRDFIFYIPFVPFVFYPNRKYFKNFVWKDENNEVSWGVFLNWFKLYFLLALIYIFQKNETLCFHVVYTLYFFPFTKTYKFLKQQREDK